MTNYKIDLHSQTILSKKNGDKISFCKSDVIDGWRKENVKIAAFTDKNTFNVDFYKKWKKIASDNGVLLFPGIELVIKRNSKESDMILNFSDKLTDEMLDEIEYILDNKRAKFFHSFKQIIDLFDKFNPLYIPHIGKSHNPCNFKLLKDNIEKIIIIESTNLTITNHKKFMKETNNKYLNKIVHFSDTHRWKEYPEYDIKTVMNEPINSFDELVYFFKNKDVLLLN